MAQFRGVCAHFPDCLVALPTKYLVQGGLAAVIHGLASRVVDHGVLPGVDAVVDEVVALCGGSVALACGWLMWLGHCRHVREDDLGDLLLRPGSVRAVHGRSAVRHSPSFLSLGEKALNEINTPLGELEHEGVAEL